MPPNAIMIFSAGLGTRMGDLVIDTPKALIKVGETTLLDHALALLRPLGLQTVVANVHYHADQVVNHLADTDVQISCERDQLLETGGGLRHALPMLGAEPVFTLNSDAVWLGPNPLRQLASAWDPEKMDGLLLLVPMQRTHGHPGKGDFNPPNRSGKIQRGLGTVYTGAQIIKTDELTEIPDTSFSLNKLWERMLARNRLSGVVYGGHWCDVGTPNGLAEANELLKTAPDV